MCRRNIFHSLMLFLAVGLLFWAGMPEGSLAQEDEDLEKGAGGTLIVNVSDAYTQGPLYQALVIIWGTQGRFWGLTDSFGKVTFSPIPSGYYKVLGLKKGYRYNLFYANVYDGFTNTIYLPLVPR